MKPTLINLALILAFLLSASGSLHAQYVTDTVRNQPVDTIISTSDANRQMQQMNNNAALNPNGYNDAKYYRWETPVFDMIDIDRIKQHRSDNEQYLYEVEVLEKVMDKNKKELRSYQDQAKDQAKVLKNEQKNLSEKRKFYREDEKLLKKEN